MNVACFRPPGAFVLSLFVALAACGPAKSPPIDSAPDPLAELRSAECEWAARCDSSYPRPVDEIALSLTDRCSLLDKPRRDRTPELLATGHVVIDDAAMAECIVGLRGCTRRSSCAKVLVGTLALGESCELDGECASGECGPTYLDPTCGRCVAADDSSFPLLPLGAECIGSFQCAPDGDRPTGCLVDDRFESGYSCQLRPILMEGDPCSGDSDAVCPDGFFCDEELGCTFSVPVGAPCERDRRCAYGTMCTGSDGSVGVCAHVVLGGEGDPCGDDVFADGTFRGCDASQDLRCNYVTGLCARTRFRERGGVCGEFDDCRDGLRCSEQLCRPFLGLGKPCAWPADCESGSCDRAPGASIATCREPYTTSTCE